MGDRSLLYAAASLRGVSSAVTGGTIGLYVGSLGLGPSAVGVVTSAGLAGGAVAMLLTTLGGDRFGRRRSLVLSCLLGRSPGRS